MTKKFRLSAQEIERLVPSLGECFATDQITVLGKRVGFMFRDNPSSPQDSGWFFMAGTESQSYLDDPKNISMFDVNTIANYDHEIIQYLTYPVGAEVGRGASGKLSVLNGPFETPHISFLPPVTAGSFHVSESWSFMLSSRMLRRVEEGCLVLWHPGLTIWLSAYTDGQFHAAEDRLARIRTNISPFSRAPEQTNEGGLVKFRYFLSETSETGNEQACCYCFALTDNEELHLAVYYDGPDFEPEIDQIWATITNSHHRP